MDTLVKKKKKNYNVKSVLLRKAICCWNTKEEATNCQKKAGWGGRCAYGKRDRSWRKKIGKALVMNRMSVSSRIHTLTHPNLQCDDSRRGKLWEVIGSWGWSPPKWNYCPTKKTIFYTPHLNKLHYICSKIYLHCRITCNSENFEINWMFTRMDKLDQHKNWSMVC